MKWAPDPATTPAGARFREALGTWPHRNGALVRPPRTATSSSRQACPLRQPPSLTTTRLSGLKCQGPQLQRSAFHGQQRRAGLHHLLHQHQRCLPCRTYGLPAGSRNAPAHLQGSAVVGRTQAEPDIKAMPLAATCLRSCPLPSKETARSQRRDAWPSGPYPHIILYII